MQQHIDTILSQLSTDGWLTIPKFITPIQLTEFRQLMHTHLQQGDFRQANVGAGQKQLNNTDIRGDEIYWLQQGEAQVGALGDFYQFLEDLRLAVNQSLYLGVFESELHFAQYPTGARYQKHIDNFQGRSPRALTFILYLNQEWQEGQGGQLRLYTDTDHVDDGQFIDVFPQGGTLVVFLSERFYHAVLPASRERLSLTGWLRRREG